MATLSSIRLAALVVALAALVAVTVQLDHPAEQKEQEAEELQTERQLKQMLSFVTPLMAILRKDHRRIKRSMWDDQGRRVALTSKSDSYSGGGGYESYYKPCCDEKNDYLGLISFIALGLLGLFLIALLSTTAAAGRKKRSSENDGDDDDVNALLADPSLEDLSKWLGNFLVFFYRGLA